MSCSDNRIFFSRSIFLSFNLLTMKQGDNVRHPVSMKHSNNADHPVSMKEGDNVRHPVSMKHSYNAVHPVSINQGDNAKLSKYPSFYQGIILI